MGNLKVLLESYTISNSITSILHFNAIYKPTQMEMYVMIVEFNNNVGCGHH